MFNNKRKNENTKIVFHSPTQQTSSSSEPVFPQRKGISKTFIALMSVIFLGAVAAYFLYSQNDKEGNVAATEAVKPNDAAAIQRQEESVSHRDSLLTAIKHSDTVQNDAQDANPNSSAYTNSSGSAREQMKEEASNVASQPEVTSGYDNSYHSKKEVKEPAIVKTQYQVPSKAYFYSQPNQNSRKDNFIDNWKNFYPPLNALDEKNGFIYVVFTDDEGKTSEGWLRKKDVKPVKTVMYASDSK
jgi:hypothetical protein